MNSRSPSPLPGPSGLGQPAQQVPPLRPLRLLRPVGLEDRVLERDREDARHWLLNGHPRLPRGQHREHAGQHAEFNLAENLQARLPSFHRDILIQPRRLEEQLLAIYELQIQNLDDVSDLQVEFRNLLHYQEHLQSRNPLLPQEQQDLQQLAQLSLLYEQHLHCLRGLESIQLPFMGPLQSNELLKLQIRQQQLQQKINNLQRRQKQLNNVLQLRPYQKSYLQDYLIQQQTHHSQRLDPPDRTLQRNLPLQLLPTSSSRLHPLPIPYLQYRSRWHWVLNEIARELMFSQRQEHQGLLHQHLDTFGPPARSGSAPPPAIEWELQRRVERFRPVAQDRCQLRHMRQMRELFMRRQRQLQNLAYGIQYWGMGAGNNLLRINSSQINADARENLHGMFLHAGYREEYQRAGLARPRALSVPAIHYSSHYPVASRAGNRKRPHSPR